MRFLPLHSRALLLLPAVAMFIAVAAIVTTANPRFSVKQASSWVRNIPVDMNKSRGSAKGKTSLVLDDNQIRVNGKSVERYYRYVQRIETNAGLEDLSQLKFYFEPSYQQLAIHYIRIYRGGSVIDALKPSEIKTIQQEEQLDEQLYNGTFASVVFMNDLRAGDVVDYAYTVSGENPVLGGRFADRIYLADDRFAEKISVRLLWPAERTLNLRNHSTEAKPSIQKEGNETEYLWEQDNVTAVEREDSVPGWVDQVPAVDLSEFKTWEDVVNWALPLFNVTTPVSPELAAKAEKWKNDLKTPEERLLAALRFVQDEVRYLGIEMGRYSHQPTQPAKVFSRRFGDCKDKSLLLAAMLNMMGIDAAPALVNARRGRALDTWQPTAFAFNHVIVQVKLADKTYWFDSTISSQRGNLSSYYSVPYERALVLRSGSQQLETIPAPAPDSGSTSVTEVYTINSYFAPAQFVVTTVYKGANADSFRYDLSSQSTDELSKSSVNYYAKESPSIRADGNPEINDDQNSNTIIIKEKYIIDNLWNDSKHYFIAHQIYDELNKPSITKRSQPFAITYPLNVRQTIDINLPDFPNFDSDSESINDEAVRFSYRLEPAGNRIRIEYELKSVADYIPAQSVSKHISAIEQMRRLAGIQLPRGNGAIVIDTGPRRPMSVGAVAFLMMLLILVIVLCLIFAFRWRGRRRLAGWQQAIQLRAGETAGSAINVRSGAEIASHLANFKCGCGRNPYQAEAPPTQERFTYDGRKLIGVRLKCGACSRSSDLYFAEITEAGAIPATN